MKHSRSARQGGAARPGARASIGGAHQRIVWPPADAGCSEIARRSCRATLARVLNDYVGVGGRRSLHLAPTAHVVPQRWTCYRRPALSSTHVSLKRSEQGTPAERTGRPDCQAPVVEAAWPGLHASHQVISEVIEEASEISQPDRKETNRRQWPPSTVAATGTPSSDHGLFFVAQLRRFLLGQ